VPKNLSNGTDGLMVRCDEDILWADSEIVVLEST
jgi:hypothetical protein